MLFYYIASLGVNASTTSMDGFDSYSTLCASLFSLLTLHASHFTLHSSLLHLKAHFYGNLLCKDMNKK